MNTGAIQVSSTLLGLSLACGLLLTAAAATAQTYTVTTTADFNYGHPNGLLSLRAALNAANNNPGEDTIVIPAGTFTLTQTGSDEDYNLSGDLDIRESVVITGAGPNETIIDGGNLDRVIHIPIASMPDYVKVSISSLTIANGRVTAAMSEKGGAGICNWKSLILDKVVLSSNTVVGTLPGSRGGGIYNQGYLTVLDSTFIGNYADSGGGLFVQDTMHASVRGCLFTNNRASFGSAIGSNGYLGLENTTIHGNIADGRYALDIFAGSAVIHFCTITGNTAVQNSPAVYSFLTSNFFFNYNIVAGNHGGVAQTLDNCWFAAPGPATFNLEDGNTCDFPLANRINTDPKLGPLADNGGYTRTRALLKDSPAIDGVMVANTNVTTDQRGYKRPQGTYPDIGAYEYENDQTLCFPVKSANNQIAIICM